MYIYVHLKQNIYIYIHMYMLAYINIHIYIYIYTYIYLGPGRAGPAVQPRLLPAATDPSRWGASCPTGLNINLTQRAHRDHPHQRSQNRFGNQIDGPTNICPSKATPSFRILNVDSSPHPPASFRNLNLDSLPAKGKPSFRIVKTWMLPAPKFEVHECVEFCVRGSGH